MKVNVRLIYLYLLSFVGLVVLVVGSIRIIDLGLKVFVFAGADQYEIYVPEMESGKSGLGTETDRQKREMTRQRQRELSGSLAMIAVGLPLYLYHWKTIQKENKPA